MKYLSNCLIISMLLLAGGLSAQQYRLRADLGASGAFNSLQKGELSAAIGLEALINLSPRTFLVPEAGLQQVHISHDGVSPPDRFILGSIPISFFNTEAYEMKRTSAYVGLGVERHLHRFRVHLFGRAVKGVSDQITFREDTDFQGGTQPNSIFSVTVKPGEVFSQGMQSGTLSYSQDITFFTGLSVRFDLAKNFDLGVAYLQSIGAPQLERRVISFCENCPTSFDNDPERSIGSETNTISISGRYKF